MRLILITALFLTSVFFASSQATDVFGNRIPSSPQKEDIKPLDDKGLKHGTWKSFFTNGQLKFTGEFEHGKPVGKHLYYYPDGTKKAELEYLNPKESIAHLYDKNGKLISQGKYLDQQKNGKWITYPGKGFYQEEYFDQGELTGNSKLFAPDGTIIQEVNYTDGLRDGWLKQYYRNGSLRQKIFFESGYRENDYFYYFEDGDIQIQGEYEKNRRTGNWIYNRPNGEVKYILKYSNDELLNPEAIEEEQRMQFLEMERNRDQLKDPEDYIQNPEYLLQ